ncbi:MFS transporter [Aestuariimicrobium ganziense]|uniref:MFS transporter n=1 Tax=Aestuariimicrobium ganziense TaxID=2773677 RepID=UPI002E28F5E9|nr:MFS transporter [Aestuariimicrobium ganziense]
MEIWRSLKRLWRHRQFRKLLGVRIATQVSDGTLQVGMASYVLFSPQSQPNAIAIATVLAITLLPFSVLGPFASVVLDRWSRQRAIVVTDGIRGLIALSLAVLVWSGDRSAPVQSAMFGLLLVAMSLNRFLLAGLTAALPHTVTPRDYLTASSIMPVIGPSGVMVGGLIAGGLRLLLSPRFMPAHHADAIVFVVSATLFAVSVSLGFLFRKHDLGPERGLAAPSLRQVWPDLADTCRHLGEQGAARLGLLVITAQRFLFGVMMVGVILGYRNHFHEVHRVNAAMADMGLWAGAMGVGFVLSAALVPPLGHAIGLRRTVLVLLVASGLVQAIPGAMFTRPTLVASGFALGLFAQALKICIDTVCQAHVADAHKGRVFVLYDMVFNGAIVVAAVAAIWLLPPTGLSVPVFVGLGVGYLLLAASFWHGSRRQGDAGFNAGTGLVPADEAA